ncbi:hypothetical protein, partial [Sporisorium scitamineum]
MTCSNACTSWKQLLVEDQAYVTAQATKWSDATSVTISFSHVAGDAYTIRSILDAWQRVLEGKEVERLEDLGKDPFIKYLPKKGEKEEELPLGWTKLGFIKKVKLISNLLWDIQVRRPEKSFKQYYVYMPQAKLDALMEQARADLEQLAAREAASTRSNDENYTISTFNLLFAWLLQNIHAPLPNPSNPSNALTI